MSFPIEYKIHWSNGSVTESHFRNIVGPIDKQDYARRCSENMVERMEDGEFKNAVGNDPIGFSFVIDGNLAQFNWQIKGGTPK